MSDLFFEADVQSPMSSVVSIPHMINNLNMMAVSRKVQMMIP